MTDEEMELRDTLAVEIAREIAHNLANTGSREAALEVFGDVYRMADAVLSGRKLHPIPNVSKPEIHGTSNDEAYVRENWPGEIGAGEYADGWYVVLAVRGTVAHHIKSAVSFAAAWAEARRIVEERKKKDGPTPLIDTVGAPQERGTE
jgi:hypothetical protein